MIQKFYFISLVVITIFILYLYFNDWIEHEKELKKIEEMEIEIEAEKKKIEELKALTKECSVKNLNSPRQCYIGSNYQCVWNKSTNRCEPK